MNKIPTPEAVQLIHEALNRIESPSENGNGGTMQVGGAFWRLAKVLTDFLHPILEHHEGAQHARHIRESLRPLCAQLFGVEAKAREARHDQLFVLGSDGYLRVKGDGAFQHSLLRGGHLLLEQACATIKPLFESYGDGRVTLSWFSDVPLTENGEGFCDEDGMDTFHGQISLEAAIEEFAMGEAEALDELEDAFSRAVAAVRARLGSQ